MDSSVQCGIAGCVLTMGAPRKSEWISILLIRVPGPRGYINIELSALHTYGVFSRGCIPQGPLTGGLYDLGSIILARQMCSFRRLRLSDPDSRAVKLDFERSKCWLWDKHSAPSPPWKNPSLWGAGPLLILKLGALSSIRHSPSSDFELLIGREALFVRDGTRTLPCNPVYTCLQSQPSPLILAFALGSHA